MKRLNKLIILQTKISHLPKLHLMTFSTTMKLKLPIHYKSKIRKSEIRIPKNHQFKGSNRQKKKKEKLQQRMSRNNRSKLKRIISNRIKQIQRNKSRRNQKRFNQIRIIKIKLKGLMLTIRISLSLNQLKYQRKTNRLFQRINLQQEILTNLTIQNQSKKSKRQLRIIKTKRMRQSLMLTNQNLNLIQI